MGLALWTTFLAYSGAISLVVLRQLKALPKSRFSVSFLMVLRKEDIQAAQSQSVFHFFLSQELFTSI